jgi:hypothetical protein
MSQKKSWFGVRLLFRCDVNTERDDEPLYEDRIILLKAVSERGARRRAQNFGNQEQHEYLNVYEERVSWTFVEILDVVSLSIDVPGDKSEVYYHFLNEEEVAAVKKSLQPGSLGVAD